MKLSKSIVLSLEILAAHKLRTALSVLGIVVGVAAVVVIVSVGKGAEKRILDQIRDMGTNLITVSAGQTRLVAGRQRQMTIVVTLLPADAEAIAKECPSVVAAAPATGNKLATRWEDQNAPTNVLGMTPEGFAVRNYAPASGRFFDADENHASRRVAVLGPTAVENLFGTADPIGQTVRIGRRGVPFEVIGVTQSKGVDANGLDQDDVIIVPLGAAMRRLMNVIFVQSIYVQAKRSDLLDRAEREIRDVLRRRHRLEGKQDDFTIQNQATLIAGERETAQSMTLLVGSVAGISLLVGGVGILAVMLISSASGSGRSACDVRSGPVGATSAISSSLNPPCSRDWAAWRESWRELPQPSQPQPSGRGRLSSRGNPPASPSPSPSVSGSPSASILPSGQRH